MTDERKILERVLEEATGFLDGLPGQAGCGAYRC